MNVVTGYDYDDLMLVPQPSEINSRAEVNLSVMLSGFKLPLPIIASPMVGIASYELITSLGLLGGIGIQHRFYKDFDERSKVTDSLLISELPFGVAVGLNDDYYKYALDCCASIICIDIANGYIYSLKKFCVEVADYISEHNYQSLLMAGNVVTQEGAKGLARAGVNLIRVGIGCFGKDTRILMANGFYKNIADITPGEWVIGGKGYPVKVKRVIYNGKKQVHKLKTNSFYKDTFATGNHNYLVSSFNPHMMQCKGYKDTIKEENWIPVEKLSNHVGLLPRNIRFSLPETFRIELQKRMYGNGRIDTVYHTDVILEPSYELGYIFGTFLGDGCSSIAFNNGSHTGRVSWCMGFAKEKAKDKLTKSIKEVFGKEIVVTTRNNTFYIPFYYKPLADFLDSFGKKEQKHLPEYLLVNNVDYLRGLLDGLIDTDGSKSDNRTGFCNTSQNLLELFNVLCFVIEDSLPIQGTRTPNAGKLHNVSVLNCKESYCARLLKNKDARRNDDFHIIKFTKIEETDQWMDVYDLEVEDDHHSFIADNCIVHNSGALCTTRRETGIGYPQLSAIDNCVIDGAYVIADGGINNSGKAVKALAAGSSACMLGTAFAKCQESNHEGIISGSSSERVQRITNKPIKSIEGIDLAIDKTTTVKEFIDTFVWGMKSGYSYVGAHNTRELQAKAQWVTV